MRDFCKVAVATTGGSRGGLERPKGRDNTAHPMCGDRQVSGLNVAEPYSTNREINIGEPEVDRYGAAP